jgi:DNA-binding NtrC family response regulator
MDDLRFKELSILVVDDEPDVCLGIKHLVKSLGCEVKTASSAEMALTMFEVDKFDLVLSDISMPGMKGNELLKVIKSKWPFTEVILITGFGTIELAVNCLQAGAAHFISKPFDNDEIKDLVSRVGRKILADRKSILNGSRDDSIVAESAGMKAVIELVKQVAPTKVSVLIEGNTGTGKEVVARALHEYSQSSDKEYLAVNCAALPDTLLESELFGHKKGAYTGADSERVGLFAKAKGGTIFLDEISSMSLPFQGKLLRVLQEKVIRPLGSDKDFPVDFRLVSASNQNLQALIKEGKFREDLFYRINTMTIRIPPLKDRKEDVIALSNYFLKICARDCLAEGANIPQLSIEAIDALTHYEWPGNVRELKNVIQSALIMCRGDKILVHNLHLQKSNSDEVIDQIVDYDYEKGKQKVIAKFQRQLIIKSLEKTGGNVTHAAEKCGLTRAAFQKIMKSLEIDRSLFKFDT